MLMVIHHLAVDGVSWRILLEDIGTGLQKIAAGEPPVFQQKTNSYRHWAGRLLEYAQTKKLLKELEYWKTLEAVEIQPMPFDFETAEGKLEKKYRETVTMELDVTQTAKVLTGVNHAYNTEINEILLAALTMAVKDWGGIQRLLIELESHGREKISVDTDIDISRTVGWFTSHFPVILETGQAGDIAYGLKAVKETLRRVPNRGVGYGVLRYLADQPLTLEPEVQFNFLGQFGQEAGERGEDAGFEISHLSTGESFSPEAKLETALDVNGMIMEGKLVLY